MKGSFWIASGLAVICAVALGVYAFSNPVKNTPGVDLAFPGVEMGQATSTGISFPGRPRVAPAGQTVYQSDHYHFSLFYPTELAQKIYDEGGGASTIVFQNPQDALGFEIFVVPYSDSQVSKARFLEDERSGVRTGVSNVTIDGVVAASFYGQNASLGDTSEIWFIRDGYLYEVAAPKSEAQWLSQIMSTWQFL